MSGARVRLVDGRRGVTLAAEGVSAALRRTPSGLTFTGGGTLSFAFLRPPPHDGTAYTAAPVPHADVAVVANVEASADINPGGESLLRVTFTAAADGVVTFADQSQL